VRAFLAVIASAVMLCGCTQQIGQLAASVARDNYQKCTADNKATPEFQMLAARLWQNDGTDTVEKLNDPKPLTPAQRNAFVQVHNRALKCRQIVTEYDNKYAAWEAPYYQALFQRSDQLFYKLASGIAAWRAD